MNRDLISCIAQAESVRPQVASGNVNGEGVDLQGADSASVLVTIGAITGAAGDAQVTLEESDQLGSGYAAVAAADILGTEPTLAADSTYRFGYSGSKRYIRAVFSLGGETNVAVSAMIVKGHLSQKPEGSNYPS